MLTIFLKVLAIFIMVAIGYIACKAGVLPEEANPYMVNLLMSICCPAMILSGMTGVELTSAAAVHVTQVMTGSVIFFACFMALAYFLVKAMGYEPAEDRGALMVVVTACNTGFMGFPVTRSIFGDYFFFLMVMENVILNVYLFILVPWQLTLGEGRRKALPEGSAAAAHAGAAGHGRDVAAAGGDSTKADNRFVEFIRHQINPNNICVILGLIFLFGHIKLPGVALEVINIVGDTTVPISMIVIGMQLASKPILEIFQNGKLVLCCFANVLLVPLVTLAAVHFLPIAVETKLILVFAACFPTAVIPVALASKMGRNATLLAQGVSLTTLLSLASLPLFASLLTQLYL